MSNWLTLGLKGQDFKATLWLYLLGLAVLCPVAALIALFLGPETALRSMPLLVIILVSVEYALPLAGKRYVDRKSPQVLSTPFLERTSGFLIRAFDIVFAFVMLLLQLPLFLVVSILLKSAWEEEGGPLSSINFAP